MGTSRAFFTLIIISVLLISIPIFSGCSDHDPGDPVAPGLSLEVSLENETCRENTRYLWGLYEFHYDAETVCIDVVPVRAAADHWNVLQWLENGPCTNCVKVTEITPSGSGTLECDVEITHPFANDNFTGFDVRGIAMFQGARNFPIAEHKIPDRTAGTGECVNPDGFAALMAPWTTASGAPPLKGYIEGNFASAAEPNATLNAFRRFVSFSFTNPRNAFYAGTSITRMYEIDMPDGDFVFGYAVDACWAPPIEKPVDNIEEDFPSEANCIEPWYLDVEQDPVGPGFTTGGGAVVLYLDIYHYVPGTVTHIWLECPELFSGQVEMDWMGFTGDWVGQARKVVVNTEYPPAGEYSCLITVEHDGAYGNPEYLDLNGYQVTRFSVSEADIHGFARTWGSGESDYAYGVSADKIGNVYVAGGFRGTADFNPGLEEDNHTSNGESDCFLSKYDTLGDYQWTKTWGGPGQDIARCVAFGGTDYVYVGGEWTDTVDFDPDPEHVLSYTTAGGIDGFVCRYDIDGEFGIVRVIQGTSTDLVMTVATDSDGYFVAGGSFSDGAKFHFSDTPHSTNGAEDAFIARYWTNGDLTWAHTWGGNQTDRTRGVAIDDELNVLVTGSFQNFTDTSGVDLDPGTGSDIHTSWGTIDVFLSKFDEAGAYQWGVHWGGSEYDYGNSVATGNVGDVYVCGDYEGVIDFDPGPGEYFDGPVGMSDAYVCKYGPDGTFDWARSWGGTEDDTAYGVACDNFGNPSVAGYFVGTVDFDPTSGIDEFTSAGVRDAFICKYALTSAYLWTRIIGGASGDEAKAIDIGEGFNTYVAGTFNSTAEFAPPASPSDEHTSNGDYDAFFVKYTIDGSW